MALAQRFTTEFIDVQDRIRISAAVSDDAVDVIWLTKRLLDRLVSHLGLQLEQTTAVSTQTHTSAMLQAFEQQAAVVSHLQHTQQNPMPPVTQQQAQKVHEWLVTEVDITPLEDGCGMKFRGAVPEQIVELSLTSVQLRQWLGIVHGQYVKGQWSLDAWPQWMNDPVDSATGGASPSAMVH